MPVGEDQKQHIELIRDIALSLNRTYDAKIFEVPEHTFSASHGPVIQARDDDELNSSTGAQARVASLRQPTLKMSKSHPDARSRILLTDTEDQVASKIKGAVTDSLGDVSVNYEERPGIYNLLSLYAGLQDQEIGQVVRDRFVGQNAGALKRDVTELINAKLQPIRKELERLHQDQAYIEQVERQGAAQAQAVASRTLLRVKQAIGLA